MLKATALKRVSSEESKNFSPMVMEEERKTLSSEMESNATEEAALQEIKQEDVEIQTFVEEATQNLSTQNQEQKVLDTNTSIFRKVKKIFHFRKGGK